MRNRHRSVRALVRALRSIRLDRPLPIYPSNNEFRLLSCHLKACPYFMDTVRNGFKLCRLVDDILWRCDLAAIM